MIIMIIFLILSAVLLIGTIIYIKHKQDKFNIEPKIKNKRNKQLSDIFQIKIKDNIICIGNRYSSVIRLGNIDYNMLSITEQNSVENTLIQTALSIDYPIQFFSTTEFIDTSNVVEKIKQNKITNKLTKEYQDNLINYLENLMENRTISVVKSYAIISYDGKYENAIEELNRKTLSFKSNLLRANISCELLEENELYNLIYRELNKNSSLKIDNLKEGGKSLYVGKKQENKSK